MFVIIKNKFFKVFLPYYFIKKNNNIINMKKKILFIDIEGGFGGSSRSLLNIILNLNKKKFSQ